MVGLETAKLLTFRGHAITLFEMRDEIGTDMPSITRIPLLLELRVKGVKLLPRTTIREVFTNGVGWENDGRTGFFEADTVIGATPEKPNDELQERLQEIVPKVHLVGDCRCTGDMLKAIADAFALGLQI